MYVKELPNDNFNEYVCVMDINVVVFTSMFKFNLLLETYTTTFEFDDVVDVIDWMAVGQLVGSDIVNRVVKL